MKIGIFIGSFNPPHIGHIHIIDYLLNNKYVDKIILIPTKNYWHKQNIKPLKDRINMLKMIEKDNLIITDKYSNYDYTYQILNKVKEDTNEDIYLIIGADNLINLDKWNNIDELLKYKIIVLNRNNIDMNKYIEKYNSNNFILIPNFNYINISSTDIRNGKKEYIKKDILEYIERNKLYEEI